MATTQIHVRSISLPSRSLLPTDHIELGLQKFKSNFQISVDVISSDNIKSGLLGLAELYNSVEELTLQLSKSAVLEESLSSSVELLDSCSAIRELFQMIKENVRTLQSALRRKGQLQEYYASTTVQDDVKMYFSYRKKMGKFAAKTLKALKNLERKIINPDHVSAGNVLREITRVSIAILKGILVFLFCNSPMAGGSTTTKGWSLLVSKLMNTKESAGNLQLDQNRGVVNEFEGVDFTLTRRLQAGKMIKISNGIRIVDVQKSLENLEAVVRGFEGGMEVLFRQLVRSRVTLLNIITDH